MSEETPNPKADEVQDAPVEETQAEETQDDQQEDNLPKNTVAVEDAGTLKKKVIVTVHRARIDGKLDEMFGELNTSAQVPGFRVGRAPRRLIEKRFGKEVGEDVRNALIGESIGSAVEDADLKTMGEPDIKLDDIELPDTGDMEFSFEVEIEPEFALPETKGITVNKEIFDVDNEKIDEYISNIREGMARYEKTEDAAADGDGILAAAKITGDGVEHENPRVPLRVAPGLVEGLPIVDLGKELLGKKVGDVATLKTTAAETHPNEDWREKELTVELTIHEVSRRIIPELNEEFAISAGFDSVDGYRQFVADRLKERVEMEIQNSLRGQICEYLIEKTDIGLPEGVIARQTQRTLQRQMLDLMQKGVSRERIQENQTQLQAAAEETATKDLKLSFILGKFADEADISVGEDEINARIAQMAAQYRRRPERLRQELAAEGALEQVGESIREEKAIDILLKDAKIVEVSPEEKPKATAKKAAKKKTAPKKAAEKSDDKDTDKPKATEKKKTAKKTAKKAVKKTDKKE